MLQRIAALLTRHHMFPPTGRIGVAVSGGADSVFLLHALRELAPDLQLGVVHIDHGIRGPASEADAQFVQRLAAGFDLPFHLHRAQALAVDDNLEQAARNIRQAFFAELLASNTVDRIATGHTRSDQAETVLYRLFRGSGLAGLSGILPVTKEGLVRPLLECERAEIEAWLRGRNLTWVEDATNRDPRYARNRLRHQVLPQLREAFNPRLDEALAITAELAQDEEAYWETEIARHLEQIPGTQILPTSKLTGQPPALARRIVRCAIELAKGDLRQIDFRHVERILEMAASAEGSDRIQLPGLDVMRSFEWIRMAPPGTYSSPDREFTLAVEAPGSVELPGASARIILQVLEKSVAEGSCATVGSELDWKRLTLTPHASSGLEVRNWRPGDQYQPVGQSKREKIKYLFQEARIPLWERRSWPIITYNGTIVWVRRFGAAAEFAADSSTQVFLRVSDAVF